MATVLTRLKNLYLYIVTQRISSLRITYQQISLFLSTFFAQQKFNFGAQKSFHWQKSALTLSPPFLHKCDSRAHRRSRRSATDDTWKRTHTLETLLLWRAERAVKGHNAKSFQLLSTWFGWWSFALSLLGCRVGVWKLILVLDSWRWEWLRFWTAGGERVKRVRPREQLDHGGRYKQCHAGAASSFFFLPPLELGREWTTVLMRFLRKWLFFIQPLTSSYSIVWISLCLLINRRERERERLNSWSLTW